MTKEKVKMRCKIDGISAIAVTAGKRIVGRGTYLITWKHSALRDEGGNPYCGKTLTDDDVEPDTDPG